ncbi:MAG: FkbM family methyltransferase [Candidatus Korobacteraceae bacterium]
MSKGLKKLVRKTLKKFDIGIERYGHLQEVARNSADLDLLLELPNQYSSQLLRYLRRSKAQLRQDLFVLSEVDFKRNGFFVEFGAADGIDLSNTYLLEKEFGWSGILAEPATCWQGDLKKNRNCHISTECVWSASNSTLTFNEAETAELSTIHSYSATDAHRQERKKGKTYDVTTISLEDLLAKYSAPRNIDYLSIDTEGSEYQILSNFNFDSFQFRVITCEHNFMEASREAVFSLLTEKGYVRKFEKVSQFDDWYVKY